MAGPNLWQFKVARLPHTIHKILLISDTLPDVEGNPVLEHDETLHHLHEVLTKDDRIVLLRPQLGVRDSDAPINEHDWLDRVNGGEGYWAATDRDDVVNRERGVLGH